MATFPIGAYNNASTLLRAIEAVLAQTVADLELIVIDDGSTDESASVAAGVGDERVRLLRMPG
jgi:glycosyltransferase involved in cell wall biosynthesis